MRNWKNWLFPILTVLTVMALAILPLRLSMIQDGKLTGTVHAEPLSENSNFPFKPPELPVRLRLLSRYEEGSDLLTVVGTTLEEDAREWLEANALAREEALLLMEAGIIPEEYRSSLPDSFLVSKLFLREPSDLSSASFLIMSAYDNNMGAAFSLTIDAESGKTMSLRLYHAAFRKFAALPEDIGAAFLDRLGLDWELLDSTGTAASFRVPDSGVVYFALLSRDGLEILPQPDWAEEDRQNDPAAAYGYPLYYDAAIDW